MAKRDNLLLEEGTKAQGVFAALREANLERCAQLRVSQLSEGQGRRVALLRLFCARHRLWLLDEPLTALDEQAREWLRRALSKHAQQGGCALIASHNSVCQERSRVLWLGERA